MQAINKVAVIGENMSVRRMTVLTGDQVVSYVHNSVTDGMGKIGVLVALKGDDEAFGRQVAMHMAAVNPASLGDDDLDAAFFDGPIKVQVLDMLPPLSGANALLYL